MRKYIAVNTVETLSGGVIVSLEDVRRVSMESGVVSTLGSVHEIAVTYDDGTDTRMKFAQYEDAKETFQTIGRELGLEFSL